MQEQRKNMEKSVENYSHWSSNFILLLFPSIIILFTIFFYFYKTSGKDKFTLENLTSRKKTAIIEGKVNINGSIPEKSKINILKRKYGEKQFSMALENLPVQDQIGWQWNQAEYGALYELQIQLKKDSRILSKSKSLIVSAPAKNETITLNSSNSYLGASVENETDLEQTYENEKEPEQPSQIAGQVILNGFYPDETSSISIAAKADFENQYSVIINDQALPELNWRWSKAESGLLYNLVAYLVVEGEVISESANYQATAPADHAMLTINSSFLPDTSILAKISGQLDLNGPIKKDSKVIIGIKEKNENDFSPVLAITPVDQAVWNFNKAISGQEYDIVAYLSDNGNNYAQSEVVSIPAPAKNVILRINATE